MKLKDKSKSLRTLAEVFRLLKRVFAFIFSMGLSVIAMLQ